MLFRSLTPEEAKNHPQRNVILQALGIQNQVDVAISLAELRRGDQIVLCSDGLSGKVDAEEIKELLERFEPKAACQGLVRMARERGDEDNITVIVARFNGDGLPEPKPDDVAVDQHEDRGASTPSFLLAVAEMKITRQDTGCFDEPAHVYRSKVSNESKSNCRRANRYMCR